jgi:hypothetical protein
MMLIEWLETHCEGWECVRYEGGAIAIPDRSYSERAALWALDDYAVSSVVAGTIWLVPKREAGQ